MSEIEPPPQKLTLTDQLRARTVNIIDPVVTVLARLNVSPDVLTVAGMLLHFLYAWLIAIGRLQLAAILIFLFVPLDALDGALARKIGRAQGNFGAFLDSTSDRIAEIILFAGFLIYFADQGQTWLVVATYLALSGSLMVSYARSRAEALGLSCKVGILSRVERYVVIVLALIINRPAWGIVILAVGTYITLGQRIYHVWQQAKARQDGQ
jgi:CDP-diacylglycerol--glycerol-3-phosphate 3-phosphatidyltransferase